MLIFVNDKLCHLLAGLIIGKIKIVLSVQNYILEKIKDPDSINTRPKRIVANIHKV